MVSLTNVYDAFLGRVNEDDWAYGCTKEDLDWFLKDWRTFLNAAIAYFKFPRCSLEIDEETQCFIDDKVSQEEIQVLAAYMKFEYLSRTVDSWENIKTQYDEKDFSQAHLLSTFISLKEVAFENALDLERIYYRSRKKKPFKYGRLAGGSGRHKR